MSVFLGQPKVRFCDNSGNALASGKVYVYKSNSKLQGEGYPTLADAEAATNALTNPISLDSRGEATIVLDDIVQIVVTDSKDNIIWTLQNVNLDEIVTDTVLYDANQNEILRFLPSVNAVNELTVTNAATGTPPRLSATGDDTNVDLQLLPKGTGSIVIRDGNANEVLTANRGSSTANSFVTVSNAATATPPILAATGVGVNLDLNLQPKGTGFLRVAGNATTSGTLVLHEGPDLTAKYIALKAATLLSSDTNFILPGADGTAGAGLKTDGSATLSFSLTDATIAVAASSSDIEAGTSLTSYVSPGLQQYHKGSCKAWVKADFAGTASVSFNVASVSDLGTGQAGVSTSSLDGGSYPIFTTVLYAESDPRFDWRYNSHAIWNSQNDFTISVTVAGSGTLSDANNFYATVYGNYN